MKTLKTLKIYKKIKSLGRLYETIKPLRKKQWVYQLKYRLFKPIRTKSIQPGEFKLLDLRDFPPKNTSFVVNNETWHFQFLNQSYSKNHKYVDWEFGKFGLLWTYNLNYFDFLHQINMNKELGLEIIKSYYSSSNNSILKHPYPTSLRIINISKFIAINKVNAEWLFSELVADLKLLHRRIEYHLLANHYLENGFALFIGGHITDQKIYIEKGRKIIEEELIEQVLDDGMHYERSPMYHLIILERLLDTLNFSLASGDDLRHKLLVVCRRMLSLTLNWENLERIPMMQDSTYDIALPVSSIIEYGKNLLGNEFPKSLTGFRDSGYRKIDSGNLSAFVNLGEINPGYQPAHSHADELNFELFFKGEPLIVDTGISTYENNEDRLFQRSTLAHNCVTINNRNSSDVWSSFRVGKRARVNLLKENDNSVLAERLELNSTHRIKRHISLFSNEFVLEDSVSNLMEKEAKGRLHFHPNVHLNILNDQKIIINTESGYNFLIESKNVESWQLDCYEYSCGFNCSKKSKFLIYHFTKPIQIKLKVVL